jgi:hypothetical protein
MRSSEVFQGRRTVDKVSGPTWRSAGLLAGRIHLTGTSRTLVGGGPWVPMSHGTLSEKLTLVTGKAPITDQVLQISQER